MNRRLPVLLAAPIAALLCAPPADALPPTPPGLVAAYDFEHPVPGDPARELDRGPSGTTIDLVNGGAAMRVADGAYPGSTTSIQTTQVDPVADGNDDWKAGAFAEAGVPSLHAFNRARGATVMGWFKVTGQNPSPNTVTPDPSDLYNAVGLTGVLSGDSDGHDVRALLEVIDVNGTLRLVALGRRTDGHSSQTFAADDDWRSILPPGQWVSLAATFDFDHARMALYRNGEPLSGFYVLDGDPWEVAGPPEPDLTSPTDPRGIKIGGSFPQNTLERNPCNCRFDDQLFFNRPLSPGDIRDLYRQRIH